MSNRDKLLEKILKDDDDISGLIENADESLKADKEIIMAAAKLDGMSLKYADDSLKGDKEVVLAASEEDGWCALKYCSEDLKADRDFVLEIVKKDGSALGEAHESLKADKEIVLAAVMQYGDAFDDADESLKEDKDILKAYEEFEGDDDDLFDIWLFMKIVSRDQFEDSLSPIYLNHKASKEREIEFLYSNYKENEEIWWGNFKNIKYVNLVLLGEAPLRTNNYIYKNSKKKVVQSPFLNYKIIQEILRSHSDNFEIRSQEDFIRSLNIIGLVVIDMFPFTFNNKQTTFQYGTTKRVNILLDQIFELSKAWNIEPKIEAINNISNKKIKYAIRYKKHVSRCNKYFSKLDLINLSSSNMGINKTLLEAQFKKKNLF